MDIKRLLRGPLPIIVVLTLVATFGFSLLRGASGYKTVDTAQVVKAINDGTIKSAELRGGVDQTIRVITTDDKKEQAAWVAGQGRDLQQASCRSSPTPTSCPAATTSRTRSRAGSPRC